MEYSCPKCGHHTVHIWATAEARLMVSKYQEVIVEGPTEFEWDNQSAAICPACGHEDTVYFFEKHGERYCNENIIKSQD